MADLKNWRRIALEASEVSMVKILRQTTASTHLASRLSLVIGATRGMSWVGGYHSIDAHKKRVLQRGSKAYINQLQNSPKRVRFEVIDVLLSQEGEGDVSNYNKGPLFSKHYTTSYESRY